MRGTGTLSQPPLQTPLFGFPEYGQLLGVVLPTFRRSRDWRGFVLRNRLKIA